MIKIDVSVQDMMTGELKSIQKELTKLPKESHRKFVELTPIDTGNARRSTKLVKDTIEAKYPYAERLDKGWSKQAPKGMTQPWQKWFEEKLKKIFGR